VSLKTEKKKTCADRSRSERVEKYREIASFGVCYNVQKAARLISNFHDRLLRPLGLRSSQFALLSYIHLLPDASLEELAQAMSLDGTTITRRLAPLKTEGWILEKRGADRRKKEIRLSPRGEKLLKKAYPVWKSAQRHFIQGMGRDEWRALKRELEALNRLSESPPGAPRENKSERSS